jgi:hypothetical protein
VIRLRAGSCRFRIPAGQPFFFRQIIQTGSRTYTASFSRYFLLFLRVKWPGRDTDHSPPSDAEVKN